MKRERPAAGAPWSPDQHHRSEGDRPDEEPAEGQRARREVRGNSTDPHEGRRPQHHGDEGRPECDPVRALFVVRRRAVVVSHAPSVLPSGQCTTADRCIVPALTKTLGAGEQLADEGGAQPGLVALVRPAPLEDEQIVDRE